MSVVCEQLFKGDNSRPQGVDVSPIAMAQYLMLTGDFQGVQQAVEDLVSSGLVGTFHNGIQSKLPLHCCIAANRIIATPSFRVRNEI